MVFFSNWLSIRNYNLVPWNTYFKGFFSILQGFFRKYLLIKPKYRKSIEIQLLFDIIMIQTEHKFEKYRF